MMNADHDLTELARILGEPTRIRMLALLMEGRALTAKELAHGAGVEPATATAHLRRLQQVALIDVTAQGRHKYFRLASEQVAELVESMMAMASATTATAPVAASVTTPERVARFCYDHLAGQLGTRVVAVLLQRGWLVPAGRDYIVTDAGAAWFAAFGLDLAGIRTRRRAFARQCLDWSERRDHLAGALGAALAERMLVLDWIRRIRHTRAVAITDIGRKALHEQFGLDFDAG